MDKFKKGTLHSGSKTGKKVKSRAQAIKIMLEEKRAEGKKVPPQKKNYSGTHTRHARSA